VVPGAPELELDLGRATGVGQLGMGSTAPDGSPGSEGSFPPRFGLDADLLHLDAPAFREPSANSVTSDVPDLDANAAPQPSPGANEVTEQERGAAAEPRLEMTEPAVGVAVQPQTEVTGSPDLDQGAAQTPGAASGAARARGDEIGSAPRHEPVVGEDIAVESWLPETDRPRPPPAPEPTPAQSGPYRPRAAVPSPLVIASGPERPGWHVFAVVGVIAAVAIAMVVVVDVLTSQPPAPPEMPNPLRNRVSAWVAAGDKADPATVEGAVRVARAGLASGTHQGMREAWQAARSALLVDVDAPAGIAIYGQVLARWPDRVDDDELDEALGAITSAVGGDPDSAHRADLEIARTWLYLRSGKVEAARQAAKRALERVDHAEAHFTYAVARLRTRPADAAADLQALADAGEASVHVPRWLGEAYLRAGDVARALRVWRASDAGRPESIGVMRRMARLAADIGDVGGAQERLEAIDAAGWAGVEDRLLLARVYGRLQRNPEGALAQLDAGLADADLSPLNRARLICEKAVTVAVHRAAAPAEEVSAWLDTALELAPDLPELLYVAGIVDEEIGSMDDAIDSFEAATEVAPERPEPALVLALLLREEAPQDAAVVVHRALEEAPHYVPLHLVRAVLALDAGNRTAASAAIRRALDYDPERSLAAPRLDEMFEPVSALQHLAKLLARAARSGDQPMYLTAAGAAHYFAGDIGKANTVLSRAARSDPRDVGARLYRAIIALRRNKRGSALRDLAAASESDSQHLVVRYYRARLAESGRRTMRDAERMYRDLLDANPLDGGARVGLARVLHARGAHEESRTEVLKVLMSRPRDRAALAFLVQSTQRSAGRGRRP
jgi:tetratricopeptide (TPR) repeat protein